MRRKMGVMFQVSGLFSDLSVFENIAFPMREHTDLPERMIRDLVLMKLHAVGLRGAYGMMPRELSGGMERRVALARAIALDPMLIMYDEPFAGLSQDERLIIKQLIAEIPRETAIVMIEHDMDIALEFAEKITVLHYGQLIVEGDRDKVVNDPMTREIYLGH